MAALKPGGWLVIEDFDVRGTPPDPAINPAETYFASSEAMRAVHDRRRSRPALGPASVWAFQANGLVEVDAQGRVQMFDGRIGADLMRVNFEQIGTKLVAAGLLTESQLAGDLARIARGEFVWPSPVMWTVRGRKP